MKNARHPTSNIQHPTSNQGWPADFILHEGGNRDQKFDLEERLLAFACAVIELSEKLPNTRAGNHIAGQILRSGTSPYPNHGEAEDAESREDFIHKLKLCLKELRETRRWARLINRKNWTKNDPVQAFVLKESDELIRIFFSSIQTAKRNLLSSNRKSQTTIRY